MYLQNISSKVMFITRFVETFTKIDTLVSVFLEVAIILRKHSIKLGHGYKL